MAIEEFRLNLLAGGYAPLPLVGKKPVFDDWPKRLDVTRQEIERWSRASPAARNTGILTKFTPVFDIDIFFDPEAAAAVVQLARERFEEHGYFLVRAGNWPKRAVPFRTDAPFPKISVLLTAPDGKTEKLEFLCDGQQAVVHGIHPVTRKPYDWHGGDAPGKIARPDLPYVHGYQVQALINDAAALLVTDFGYRRADQPKTKARKNGAGGEGAPTDWATDFADHDQLATLAMKLIKSGMNAGAVVNFLRTQVEGLTNVDEDRRARRLTEIPAMVTSAQEKIEAEAQPSEPPAPPPPSTLDRTVAVFRKWLLLEDVWPVYVTLGAIAANHLSGPPVWLGLIAPPSSAKTEILNAMLRLPKVELISRRSSARTGKPCPKCSTPCARSTTANGSGTSEPTAARP